MKSLITGACAAALLAAAPALAQPHDHSQHQAPQPTAPADPHAGHTPPAAADPHAGHGAPAAMDTRWASGTSWQPSVTPHHGVHLKLGGWDVMTHAVLNGVYDWQEGPRGDEKAFVSGMVMGMATRRFDAGELQLNAMLSPDPFMGKRGYPLLLAAGESADAIDVLVDRQHPHDLFMELSARYTHDLTPSDKVFVYAGLPGEPAFGPPTFMHRLSIMDSPEAPISHHWLDSTHIVFGVVTAGYIHDDWKVEVSRFKGREPDEDRFDIENPKLDSTAVRLSWNPTPNWSLQASWADAKSVEALDPDQDVTKWSASAIHTVPFGDDGWWSTTAAWGRRSAAHGEQLDAWVLESAVKPNAAWTIFARAERAENNELDAGHGHHGETYTVAKASIGAVRDWQVAKNVKFGVGGLVAKNWVPGGLEASYGGDPTGAMAFVRVKIE
ncbi:hypothetical protein [Phenylobacterium sp.]|jgi:hypothetical protein|uniref:hypothetical protein n=1 Tax=Phenylobacterium sp. TaxID=1871053 RepID=UPI002F953986